MTKVCMGRQVCYAQWTGPLECGECRHVTLSIVTVCRSACLSVCGRVGSILVVCDAVQ